MDIATIQFVSGLLSLMTLLNHIGLAAYLLAICMNKITKKFRIISQLETFVKAYSMHFAFIFALTATLGSLFYSEIAHFPPCDLCWYQRIFIYPQVLLLGLSLFRKDKGVWKYIVTLNIAAGIVALYHIYGQLFQLNLPCTADGISCAAKFVSDYGYITIPVMSLTIVVMQLFFALNGLRSKR